MDTAALLVQKLGVAGLDNLHIYAYHGAPFANDWNGQAMYLIVYQLVLGNLVIDWLSFDPSLKEVVIHRH
ncbi:hypothetical protein V6N11_053387 [Hibiscus sabdariffa]|uniref:Beta-amylase n=1 Tax=Hibiscus sabdariffa TaxID=183260 RepID=A0ABR2UCT5_9ROSI